MFRKHVRFPYRAQIFSFALLCMLSFAVCATQTAGDALRQLDSETWVSRSHTLADLGISAAIEMQHRDTDHQEFYLPVPTGVALDNAVIDFQANYIQGPDKSALLQLTVDGHPVLVKKIAEEKGEIHLRLPIGSEPRPSGFVRLGINWLDTKVQRTCDVAPPSVNSLSIAPATGIAYRYKTGASLTLESVWNSMPGKPVIVVSDRSMSKDVFDTAWRIGAALERSGKRTELRRFPKVRDTIDIQDLSIPAGLSDIPIFASLRGGKEHEIASTAEIGALLVLGSTALAADIVIVDKLLQEKIDQALNALEENLASDKDALKALRSWRQNHAQLAAAPGSPGQIHVTRLGARPAIAIASDAGAQAAGLFQTLWLRILSTHGISVRNAIAPQTDDTSAIRLTSLGGSATSFDVVNQGEWRSSFPLSAVAFNGRMPNELVLNVAAAPDASDTKPVVSVFWNGTLLTASKLDADGESERIKARVPGYALRLNNTLRVVFQRLPAVAGCAEPPRGYPVNILPTSYIKTGKAQPDGTFVGLLPLLAGSPELIIPLSWLSDGTEHAVQAARLAVASGLSAINAKLVLAEPDTAAAPTAPFISMEVPVKDVRAKVQIDGGRLTISGRQVSWLDIAGLDSLSITEVVTSNNHAGMLWHNLGRSPARLQQPYTLNQGNIAIIGASGPVAWIDSSNPDAGRISDTTSTAFYEWRHYVSWGVPAISTALLIFAVLLALAYRAGRKRRRSK